MWFTILCTAFLAQDVDTPLAWNNFTSTSRSSPSQSHGHGWMAYVMRARRKWKRRVRFSPAEPFLVRCITCCHSCETSTISSHPEETTERNVSPHTYSLHYPMLMPCIEIRQGMNYLDVLVQVPLTGQSWSCFWGVKRIFCNGQGQ
jgi:hypothetical protein